ncbi:MAG: hypothetical protein KC415_22830 [Anaerolineales bacterium]|nr:hypothetical protein [Anaerolineales bacterium]
MRPFDSQKLLMTLVILTLAFGGTVYLNLSEQELTTLVVPANDLPIYHLITASDLMTATLSTAVLPAAPLQQTSELAGRYTSQTLTAEEAVTDAQLVPAVDEKYVLNTTAVSISATAAMAYNGRLAAGAMVTVWTVTDAGQAQPLLEEVLVLDVQKAEGQGESEEKAFPYVVILAVPRPKQAELLTAVATGSLMLTFTP